jgi:hypothetical protein
MTKHSYIFAFLASWSVLCALPCIAAEQLAVIVHRSSAIQTLGLESIKLIFIRKTLLDENGNTLVPVNLPTSHAIRQGFSMALFNQRPEEQELYWNIQYYHGISPPHVVNSEEAMLRFVAITPNAIGYVRKGNVDGRVTVVKTLSVECPVTLTIDC